ncbi:MAG: hypothetical protein Q8Q62_05625 [Mesorhizobium sp.]|nr:hypothetical protein [Mesorhizobium sp.]
MQFVFIIFALGAAAAWLVAVASAFGLMTAAPPGTRFATIFDIGFWRFAAVESRVGPAAFTHIRRYRAAIITFFASVLAGLATGMAAIQFSSSAN